MRSSIYRKDMPQIKSEYTKDFMKFLKKKHNVDSRKEKLNLSELIPVQKDFSDVKIVAMTSRAKIEGSKFLKKRIIVSQDGYILDGHHRYMALMNLDPNQNIKVWMVYTSIENLMDFAHSFPKTSVETIYEQTTFNEFLQIKELTNNIK